MSCNYCKELEAEIEGMAFGAAVLRTEIELLNNVNKQSEAVVKVLAEKLHEAKWNPPPISTLIDFAKQEAAKRTKEGKSDV